MGSTPSDVVITSGSWNNWGMTGNEATSFYAEFHSTGPGANSSARVAWSHQLTASQARVFEPKNFLRGTDNWNPEQKAAKIS